MTVTEAGKAAGVRADPLGLLDEPLRERAEELRRLLRKPGQPGRTEVADLLILAADAAFAGDQAVAAACLDQADQITAGWAAETARIREATEQAETLAREQREADRAAQEDRRRSGAVLAGHVKVTAAPGPVIVATDGSYRASRSGSAYITSGGQWGLTGHRFGGGAPDGHHGALIAELRAAGLAAGYVEGDAVFLIDSTAAVSLLRAWQAGDVTRMPALRDGSKASGKTLRRAATRQAALAEIAAAVAARPGLEFVHVYGHRGHLLNEAADSLAKMARRWLTAGPSLTRDAMTAKADDLTAAFLRSWHAGTAP